MANLKDMLLTTKDPSWNDACQRYSDLPEDIRNRARDIYTTKWNMVSKAIKARGYEDANDLNKAVDQALKEDAAHVTARISQSHIDDYEDAMRAQEIMASLK